MGSVLKLILVRLGSEAIFWIKAVVVLHVESICGSADFLQLRWGSLFSIAQKAQSASVSVYFARMWGVPTMLCFILSRSLLSLEDNGISFIVLKLF